MTAFLRVADAMEETDPKFKVWVKQVRDVAYNAEDVLDKFELLSHAFMAKNSVVSFGHQRYHVRYGIPEQRSRSVAVNNELYDCCGDAFLLEEAEIVGIEKPKRQLIGWLVEGRTWLNAVSVVRMGGLGKMTLVKKCSGGCKYMLPDNDCGSRVIVTTRFAHIASTCCQQIDGDLVSSTLGGISVRILKRCAGLLLAIVAISGILATKDQSRIDEWEMLHRSLGAEMEESAKLESTKKVLSLSYNDVPYYLKICFLYLSIFPEDHLIEKMKVSTLDHLSSSSLATVCVDTSFSRCRHFKFVFMMFGH
ncbi:hypothetical protein Acr_00g0085940 [Actinidia rufa]|uniref:Disease resistance N-terminal domain-containing protein n=1 Tax=Actinidia rufa TaxID=165716 RepID=A0A7J0DXF3_9ERIC|nr:hypothetical protein Acr_00g0085940 [Actinidia rufa]